MQYLSAQRRQELVNGSAETPWDFRAEDIRLSQIRDVFLGEWLPQALSDGRRVEMAPGDQVEESHLAVIRDEAREIQNEDGRFAWAENEDGRFAWAKKPFIEVIDYYDDKVRQGLFFVGLVDNQPAGMIGLSSKASAIWDAHHSGDAIYLSRLTVRKAFRGTGLADAMIDWAKKVTTAEGFNKLRLDCEADPCLVSYYERKGFSKVGEPREKRPSGITPQLMEVDLSSRMSG